MDIVVLIGTAGFLTIAIGYASKTVVSNFISGVFLLIDSIAKVEDTIEIKGNKGKLKSVGLLSIKLQTEDNIIVEIPNETAVKSEIKNHSMLDIRGDMFNVDIPRESFDSLQSGLINIIMNNKNVIQNKKNTFDVIGVDKSNVKLRCSYWVNSYNLDETKSSILTEFSKLT